MAGEAKIVDRARSTPKLLDREQELERIAAASAAASAGSGRLLAVIGPAGIGKSRLLDAATETWAAGGRGVVSARGGQVETEFAFGVVRQLFEPVWAASDDRARERLLAGPAAPAASLLGAPAGFSEPRTGGDRGFATLHGLYWLTVNLAARAPLLMTIDDAHWVDAPSLRFVAYLARRVHAHPVLLMIALRDDDPGARQVLLSEVVGDPAAELLRPGLLTLDAVASLVQGAFPEAPADPELVRACWTATTGNPFLLSQLLGALRRSGGRPTAGAVGQLGEVDLAAVSRWVHLRLAGLPPAASALAGAVAVLGDGADPVHVAALAGLDAARRDDAVDALISAGIMREADGLAFVHPLVRSAIYAQLPARRRAQVHRRAATVLGGADMVWERVAPHLLASVAAGDEEVVDMLLGAARAATRAGGPDLAARYLKRALAEPAPEARRSELLRELGAAELAAGDFNAAGEHLRQALSCTGEVGARLQIGFLLRYALVWADRAHEVAPALDGVVAQASEQDPPGALLLETAVAGAAGIVDLSSHGAEHGRLRRLAEPVLRGEPAPPSVMALAAIDALFSNRPAALAAALAEQAAAGWQALPAFARRLMNVQLFIALILAEHFPLAGRLVDEDVEDARRNGSAAQFVNASVWRAMLCARLGKLADAEADAHAALEGLALSAARSAPDARAAGAPPFYATMATAVLLEVLIERGRIEEAERALAESGLAARDSASLTFPFLVGARGRLLAAQGRPREAIAEFLAVGALYRGTIVTPAMYAWRSQAALGLQAVGEPEEAARLAGEELALARAFGAPRALGVALSAAGLIAGDGGIALLREAVAVLEDSPARLEHARALVELGAATRRAGRRSAARELLEGGMDTARACGSTALAERAREELRATGARPRRVALTGVEALTGAERRVADLAVQGLTNRQIARALVVSLSTVETHLRHVFQKLGIASRAALSDHLPAPTDPDGSC